VPKRTKQLLAEGVAEDVMWRTHQELPNLVYGAMD
jgi:predicted urease superfamily metal-dependent hydrolase